MKDLYKIGEVAKMCDTTIKTIKYYEKINLIKPQYVDESTGYRYYNDDAVKCIQTIQRLKELGLSLTEIRKFVNLDTQEQLDFINCKHGQLVSEIQNLSGLASNCVKKINFLFKNDLNAVGKWKCEGVVKNKKDYLNNNLININPMCKILYLLKNGSGYEMLDGWSKGEIYYRLSKKPWKYEIENDLMFVKVDDELIQVYKKIDNKERSEPEQDFVDNINLEYECDAELLGLWKVVDHEFYLDKDKYQPRETSNGTYFIKSLSVFPNNTCLIDIGAVVRLNWTKGCLIEKENKLTLPYEIKDFRGKKYLILVWKDDAYRYFGDITWCYIFEKIG